MRWRSGWSTDEQVSEPLRHLVVGTAGHIDHGKSALVKALTGTDPDRLDEEKRRGITIELGFADLELDSERSLSFVDVPGHERFVRHMVAGATGIQAVMLVVAADQGIQPQSREHLLICQLLGVRRGIVVLTKVDLVDEDLLEVVSLEVDEWLRGSFLEGAPIVPVSARTGVGLDELRQGLAACCDANTEIPRSSVVRLPIDRAFTLKGFGTVVTGTLVGGELRQGDELEVLPGGGRVRVRGLQVHHQPVESVIAGRRVAVNLQGVHPDEVPRGSTLTRPGQLLRTRRAWVRVKIDASLVESLARNGHVRFHQGTTDEPARIRLRSQEAEGRHVAELFFDEPLALAPGDRFVLRRPSPVDTIGGGIVVDAHPPARALAVDIELQDPADLDGVLAQRLTSAGPAGLEHDSLSAALGITGMELEGRLSGTDAVRRVGARWIAATAWESASTALVSSLELLHRQQSMKLSFSRETLRSAAGLELSQELLRTLLAELVERGILQLTGDQVRSVGHKVRLSEVQQQQAAILDSSLQEDGLEPRDPFSLLADHPREAIQSLVDLLVDQGRLIRLHDGKLFHRGPIEALEQQLRTYARTQPRIGVADFKTLAGISRKNAIPLLEYLDAKGVTRRSGDFRDILI